MRLILYSKPGCHLCEGLQEKLEQIVQMQTVTSLELEIRDITTREDWFCAYQYEVPVLFLLNLLGAEEDTALGGSADLKQVSVDPEEGGQLLPRPSPRATVQQLEKMLQKYQ